METLTTDLESPRKRYVVCVIIPFIVSLSSGRLDSSCTSDPEGRHRKTRLRPISLWPRPSGYLAG